MTESLDMKLLDARTALVTWSFERNGKPEQLSAQMAIGKETSLRQFECACAERGLGVGLWNRARYWQELKRAYADLDARRRRG